MKKKLVISLLLLMMVLVGCKSKQTIPDRPSELTAVLDTQILLNWKDNSNSETEFRIYRGVNTDRTEFYCKVGEGITTFKDTLIEPGKTYYYVVTAINGIGESAASNQVSITVPPVAKVPNAPTNLSATVLSTTEIKLTWQDAADNEEGFRVYRGATETAVTTLVKEVGAGETQFTDSQLTPNTTYYYQVKAYNATGESAASNLAQGTTLPEATVPVAPSNVQATAISTSEIKLTWQDQSDDEEKFVVYRGTSETNIREIAATLNANTTTFTETGLTDDTTYYYLVKAQNATGFSAASNIAHVKTPALKATLVANIVDQNGAGIPGVSITMGTLKATTDDSGAFTFNGLEPGSYSVKGMGGRDHHYILGETQIVLAKGVQEQEFTAYQLIGAGVVMQSPANSTNQASSVKLTALKKEMNLSGVRKGVPTKSHRSQTKRISTKAIDLMGNASCIALNWEPINGAVSYGISYLHTDGIWHSVWDSDQAYPEDPAFDSSNPQAYLDLGNELAGFVTGAGNYTFKVSAFFDTRNIDLPQITVSLGMRLADFPRNLAYTNSLLSWSSVSGASQYRTLIYRDGILVDQAIHGVGVTSMIVPEEVIPGQYHEWYVDAQALDETGWLAEITRAISGFTP